MLWPGAIFPTILMNNLVYPSVLISQMLAYYTTSLWVFRRQSLPQLNVTSHFLFFLSSFSFFFFFFLFFFFSSFSFFLFSFFRVCYLLRKTQHYQNSAGFSLWRTSIFGHSVKSCGFYSPKSPLWNDLHCMYMGAPSIYIPSSNVPVSQPSTPSSHHHVPNSIWRTSWEFVYGHVHSKWETAF